ncbi:MAG TPA: nitrate/sulfonate/bicarbonate ABC transporter ATP-binding protein [Fimbriimonadaceae bacterium]|nr:nitrate/sulfonate/bicarbonate ABC transporter ATP-binding protein [Fimbriimonadaceae bacterium]
MSAPNLLQVKDVSQIYKTGPKAFTAVRGINLTIQEGDFVALVGPSGCGKSTLLRIITGLQPASEGSVLYRGKAIDGVNPHATIVFQTFALFPWLTVQQNVEIALKARGVGPTERRERSIALLDRVGLDGFETAYPRELSGGMRQKVGFARAMAVEPELLCLDEPFSALDVLSAEALRTELMALWQSGDLPIKAVLMVTHNIEEAVLLAGRVVVMEKEPGRIEAELRNPLGYPRLPKAPEFVMMVDRVYGTLAGTTQPEHVEMGTAPGQPGRTRGLPEININGLGRMLESIRDNPNQRADIYDVARELSIDSEEAIALTEAAELLGFAVISQGDIALTPTGATFIESSPADRKPLFAARIERIPIFKWLLDRLDATPAGEQWEDIVEELAKDFPAEEAEHQLDIIVTWGRYGEIIQYDDSEGVISRAVAA